MRIFFKKFFTKNKYRIKKINMKLHIFYVLAAIGTINLISLIIMVAIFGSSLFSVGG